MAASVLREQCPDMALRSRGKIKIKGKGEMKTWWVNEGVGQRRLSRDASETYLASTSKLPAVREDPSTDFLAEKPSKDFSGNDMRSSSSIPGERQSTADLPEMKQSFRTIPENTKLSNEAQVPQETAPPAPGGRAHHGKEKRSFSFVAPPGKLGIVIDTSGGSPKVYQVHPMSTLRRHVAVGDTVCEIDGVNTRTMSHTEISALMLANAGHPRKFTIEREVGVES